jgi:transposase
MKPLRSLPSMGRSVASERPGATEMVTDMRSLSREARFDKRVKVIELRRAGRSYVQIALLVGLSRTGVFDICKRHAAVGLIALRDVPGGRTRGEGRTLAPEQEVRLRQQIIDSTPDELAMPELLWNRAAVSRLIERQLGIVLPVRTLALYLGRWGFTSRRPMIRSAGARSLLVNQWLTDRYPAVAAKSKAEGGEINWGSDSRLLAEDAGPLRAAAGARAAPRRVPNGRRGFSMISAVTNKGQLRWTTFKAPLDAKTLLDFLRRLIKGASKKVFLIMDDLAVPDDSRVETWLIEHDDAIEAFRLPGRRLRAV